MVRVVEYRGKPCLLLKVCPGSSKNQVTGVVGEYLKVKIRAQPEKGKANRELLGFLADLFGVSKGELSVVQGETSKNKWVAFEHSSFSRISEKLKQILPDQENPEVNLG